MTRWKIVGIIATFIITLTPPLFLVKEKHFGKAAAPGGDHSLAEFVGTAECKSCHKQEYDRWKNSHHDLAMDVATDATVLGDFNDATFDYHGIVSRFYRRDGRFFVHTRGPAGKMGEFEIKYTFGYTPLQQYLILFPGGRLQCLPIAWDVRQKRWYHFYPDEPLAPDDWLYWTNAGQNWNGMCAECHSTNLKKNYDPDSDTYQTTWTDIDVGCEACHGPGSLHVKWARLPEMARPEADNLDLVVRTAGMDSREQVELCAPCHSRRTSLGDNTHDFRELLDYEVPQLLDERLYFADGQILEEVYVYGSFVQSKMYDRQVRCSDCHDVHSVKRLAEGNALCLQCHRADLYDTKAHHFHKKEGEKGEPIKSPDGNVLFGVGSGAKCEQCHMPGRYYMGIDYRPDHSFRVPRPDLSIQIGTPNACRRCHVDKSDQWSADLITKWYGQKVKAHYGTILAAGRRRQPEARPELVRLADDRLYPVIVRATALALLSRYPDETKRDVFERALSDEEPLMRQTALRNMGWADADTRRRLLLPMLYDSVKAVRIEAAQGLTGVPRDRLTAAQNAVFQSALSEFRQAMAYTADFAASRHNLGNMNANLGQLDKAAQNYAKAISIDSQFYPAKVNLAMIYNRQGQNLKAETLLREVVEGQPDMYEIQYSLGLLLAEQKKYAEAVRHLETAAAGLPLHSRVYYNLGQLLAFLKRDQEAEASLKTALGLEPGNQEFLYALAEFYLKQREFEKARPIALQMVERYPDWRLGKEILDFIQQQ